MAHQRAQAGQDVAGPVVELTRADSRGQLRFVGVSEVGQCIRHVAG